MFMAYFKPTVLAQYRAEPHKFRLDVADFEGKVELAGGYSESLKDDQRQTEGIDVRFGFRRHKSGEYYIAVFAPDLAEKSPAHVDRWRPFFIDAVEMSPLPDLRFESWAKRYLLGLWTVENNVLQRLMERVKVINSLTKEAFGKPLFLHENNPQLHAPIAENTHAYQDAHKEAYALLIDGLDKGVVGNLVARMNTPTAKSEKYTVKRLTLCFPNAAGLWAALEVVNLERGKASHNVRPPAEGFRAFEAFCDDMDKVVTGLGLLQTELESELGTMGEDAMSRQNKLNSIPESEGPPADAALLSIIPDLNKMVGRTVKLVTLLQRTGPPKRAPKRVAANRIYGRIDDVH